MTVHDEPGGRLIEDYFIEQVHARPDATAVVFGDVTLTYRELYLRAVVVAVGLAKRGVRRETLVGMAFEHSVEAIIATVGIVLAGGAYVPVNPNFPVQRITRILRDSDLGLMICASSARDRIASIAPQGVEVVDLAEMAAGCEEIDLDSHAPPPANPRCSPLAYVLYTSGSTGQAKGVMVVHSGIERLVKNADYFDFSADHRFLQLGALEFDASTLEIWGPLLNGGQLHVVEKETAVVPWRLAEVLREHQITVIGPTTPLFHQMVDEDPKIFAPLRTLIVGGDVLSPRHVELVREHNPHLRVCNAYGPTENTTFTTFQPVDRHYDGPIPIGRAIRGTTVLVLDDAGAPVSSGAVGELYTGGIGLARGYLNDPALTNDRFVHIKGERYYRTGDLVRMDLDGVLHFHGRVDSQVKIRGHRVEVNEVNAAVRQAPGVIDSFTRVVGELGGPRRLVTYVITDEDDEAPILRAVEGVLPTYMRPERYVLMDRFPLNTNGKVDVAKLPWPAEDTDRGAAHTPAQRRLAELWGEVLGVAAGQVAAEDSFFDVGGNSLQLGMLVGQIASRYSVQLSFADVFKAQTLAEMADVVGAATPAPLNIIPAAPLERPVDLHPQQRAMYAIWQSDPQSLAYNLPVRIDVRGHLELERLSTALTAVVRRHDSLRMRFRLDNGVVRQVPVDDVVVPFEQHDGPADDAVATFIRPFQLDSPPLLRALLVRLGPDHHELYLDSHHIAFDGVSLQVLVDELFELYGGVALAPARQYADVAQWCHDQFAAGALAAEEAYWVDLLSDAPPSAGLPTDRPRGARRATQGAVTRRTIDAAGLDGIRWAAERHGTTAFTVLLAAYFATLIRLSGQRDIVVGCPVSGRVHTGCDAVVGMFVSTVCLRATIEDSTTLAELTGQLGARHREALTHQSYPFERLVSRLGFDQEPARNPVFDALFALQNIDFYEFTKNGLEVSVEVINPGTTRFDLNLQVYQRSDRLVLELQYATELFDWSSANYLLDQYLEAVAQLVDKPKMPVLMTEANAAETSLPDFAF